MVDKSTILQIIGALMKRPQYLSETDKYCLTPDDFSQRLDKFVFVAIDSLYRSGAERINPIDVENYLETNESAKSLFKEFRGIEYLQDAEYLTEEQNFPYYYKKLKKFNILRSFKSIGVDISEFYIEDAFSDKAMETNKEFESLEINDIIDGIKKKILGVERTYIQGDTTEVSNVFEGIEEILEAAGAKSDVGLPLQGDIFNEVCAGARKGTFVIRSGGSGVSKAIPYSTPIPTPKGWTTARHIKIGDYLFDAFGKPTKVLGVFPQGVKKEWEVKFEDGRIARCCGEHLWSFCTLSQSTSARDLREFHTKELRIIAREPLRDEQGIYRILVPTNGPVEFEEKEFIVAPYLLAIFGRMEPIPRRYLEGSTTQRFELLNGLLDYNGSVDEKKGIFCEVKETALESFLELVRGLSLKPIFKSSRTRSMKIQIVGKKKLLERLFTCSTQKASLEKYLSTYREKESYSYNAIVSIRETNELSEMVCFRVENDEHLFLMNDFIVTHNTRQAVGDACFLAFPFRYNIEKQQWAQEGSGKKTLFITTEQTAKEIQRMILAYLTGFNETKFRYGGFTPQEEVIIKQALWVLEEYQENFYIIRMPNPTIELVKNIVRENVLLHEIEYVFYDYIFISPSLLNEFKGFKIRNDEILLMFSTALKDLAVELDVFMMTSTQVNANADDNKNIRNEGSLAGSRSIINKADIGVIMARPTKEELEFFSTGETAFFPNIVTDVFKVRSGEWNQVRIWSDVDLGNLRKKDLFVTNSRMEVLNVGTSFNYQVGWENTLVEKYRNDLKTLKEIG